MNWHRVEDELPADERSVLCYARAPFKGAIEYQVGFYLCIGEWCESKDGDAIEVTHWAELSLPE